MAVIWNIGAKILKDRTADRFFYIIIIKKENSHRIMPLMEGP